MKKHSRYNSDQGVASLPTVLALTLLILASSIGMASWSFSESFGTFAQNESARAYVYAESGARDALLRIARNSKYSCTSVECYSIDLEASGCTSNSACARVSVSSDNGASSTPKIITSTGRVNSYQRKVQVSVFFDTNLNGEIATTTWQELSN